MCMVSPCSCSKSNGAKDLTTNLDRFYACCNLSTIYFEIVIYIYLENTLGECRINILIKKGERERRLERGNSVILSIFLSFFRLEREKVAP